MTAVEAGKRSDAVGLMVAQWQVEGSELARRNLGNQIMLALKPVFRGIVGKFSAKARGSLSLEDLEQVAAIEAFKCFEKFDPNGPVTFEHQVLWAAKHACMRYVNAKAHDVHVSDWARRDRKTVNGKDTAKRVGETTPRVVVSSTEDITCRDVDGAAMAEGYGPKDTGARGTWGDAGDTETPEKQLDDRQTRERLLVVLGRLSPERREIVRKAFGIGNDSAESLRSIAAQLDIPRSRLATDLEEALLEMRLELEATP